ncbi:Outer membrane protein assembly factor BamB [Rickettsiales endosymbiont of Paramecium tredecaurelia]|uniref:outer membrane protein assembly factor BamB family protein n=1 Tax=Candidatus Sarmatiella mevalonica TaxID=2770581 RepID=UPI0019207457|nr:PQQ-binding-like beta-propeller repeat protein [Candidatus Sarmatiella mevalonica]MBL3285093.1 Outer membrane protein assembly factor BamB [Candidatus Sarmatiella mevalonica]
MNKITTALIKNIPNTLLYLLLLPCALTACDNNKRTRTIAELTTSLEVQHQEDVVVQEIDSYNLFSKDQQRSSFKLTPAPIQAKPLVHNNILYAVDSKLNVVAFNLLSKKILWSSHLISHANDKHIGGGVALDGNKLYVTNGSRSLFTVDADNGKVLFTKDFDDVIRSAPLVVAPNKVFVRTVNNKIALLDASQSKILWMQEGLTQPLSSNIHAAPVLYNSNILVFYNSGEIALFNKENGQPEKVINLSKADGDSVIQSLDASFACEPIIDGDFVYLALNNKKLVKLKLSDFSIVWSKEVDGIQAIKINSNNLFALNNAKQLAVLNASNGNIKRVYNLVHQHKMSKTPPEFLLQPLVDLSDSRLSMVVLGGHKTYRVDLTQPYTSQSDSNALVSVVKHQPAHQYLWDENKGLIFIHGNKLVILSNKTTKELSS